MACTIISLDEIGLDNYLPGWNWPGQLSPWMKVAWTTMAWLSEGRWVASGWDVLDPILNWILRKPFVLPWNTMYKWPATLFVVHRKISSWNPYGYKHGSRCHLTDMNFRFEVRVATKRTHHKSIITPWSSIYFFTKFHIFSILVAPITSFLSISDHYVTAHSSHQLKSLKAQLSLQTC